MFKRNIFIYLLLLLAAIFTGYTLKNYVKPVVYTPIRVGESESRITIEKLFDDLESAINNSDIVVDVTISSWIAEEEDDKTIFSAKVNSSLKGKSPNRIILFQYGSSKNTFKNYPLFDVGERMLVFLKKATASEYKDAYYLIGEHTSIIDIRKVNNNLYAADRYGILTEGLLSKKSNDGKNYFTKVEGAIKAKFLDKIYLYNTYNKPTRMYHNFFVYKELINEIKDIVNKH